MSPRVPLHVVHLKMKQVLLLFMFMFFFMLDTHNRHKSNKGTTLFFYFNVCNLTLFFNKRHDCLSFGPSFSTSLEQLQ